MPPNSRPNSGVRMSLTRLLTTPVKATPMMMPTARSTTLPRMIKVRNSASQAGRCKPIENEVRSLIAIPLYQSALFSRKIGIQAAPNHKTQTTGGTNAL